MTAATDDPDTIRNHDIPPCISRPTRGAEKHILDGIATIAKEYRGEACAARPCA